MQNITYVPNRSHGVVYDASLIRRLRMRIQKTIIIRGARSSTLDVSVWIDGYSSSAAASLSYRPPVEVTECGRLLVNDLRIYIS